MIGMMNSGAEPSVEFYSAARQSSLYDARKRSNQSRTYTAEGRILINGQPLSPRIGPDDMWKAVIIKAAAQKMIRESCGRKETGAIATIKRLSERLKLKKSKSSAAMMNLEVEMCPINETVSLPDDLEEPFVTKIRIEVVEPPFKLQESVDRPDFLFGDNLDEGLDGPKEKDSGKGSSDGESHSG